MKDYTGQKFNRLTLVGATTERKRGCIIWKMLCDCGTITYMTSTKVVVGRVKSCGCMLRANNESIGTIARKHDPIISTAREAWTYNGLDRVDRSKGHTSDNVVSCCWDCNRAKGDMTKEDFIIHIKRMYDHNF
jgi:hypothetical protein